MTRQNQTLIQFENAAMGYQKGNPVLSGVSFQLQKGDFLGLIGPNGSGKSTLLKTLLGLMKPLSGRVNCSSAIRFGYVKQRQFVDDIFPFTVGEVVVMGRYYKIGMLSRPGKADWKEVRKALERAGILNLMDAPYRNLSGGQKQRVLIARALASEPTILVLDEPTNDLDIAGEHQIMELLREINREEEMTVIVVSHLLNVVLGYARKLALTGLNHFIFDSVEDIAVSSKLTELYGQQIKVKEIEGRKVIILYD